jgi:hypothetical protein
MDGAGMRSRYVPDDHSSGKGNGCLPKGVLRAARIPDMTYSDLKYDLN